MELSDELTVGQLKTLLAALPPEADNWPVSANNEYGVYGITPYSGSDQWGKPNNRLDLDCY